METVTIQIKLLKDDKERYLKYRALLDKHFTEVCDYVSDSYADNANNISIWKEYISDNSKVCYTMTVLNADNVEMSFCLFSISDGVHTANIHDLYTIDEFRGQGLGSQILEQVELFCKKRNVKKMKIGTMQGNERAVVLYERHGYSVKTTSLYRKLR